MNARAQLVSEFGDLSTLYIALGRMDAALDYTNRMIALATELGNDAELAAGGAIVATRCWAWGAMTRR